MKLSSLLNPRLIRCGLAAKGKEEALDEVIGVMASGTPGVTAAEIRAALAEREKLGPFSMAKGCAFPHARTEKVQEFRIALGTAPAGLDFKAPDGNPIRLVVLFVIPKKHSNLYLTTLAQFLNVFGVEENLQRVLKASTGEEFVAAVDALPGKAPAAPVTSPLATVTPATTLSKALEVLSSSRADAVPVVDAEGNLLGELTAAALLQLGVREHFLRLSSTATLKAGEAIDSVLRSHADAPIESLGVVSPNGFRTVQEDEPLVEMAVRLCHAGARSAYVLRGKKLAGLVTTGEVLKRISGGR
jgi:mannitol/fructose-specific phosphotransferase system IIA component (Ntr-type)/predicted transcriptional regulator